MGQKEGFSMRKVLAVALAGAALVSPTIARADGGEFAAGLLGGLAFSTIVRPAIAPRYYYYEPAPVYVAPAPVYPAPSCYWTRGRAYRDGYGWIRPRVRVCD